MNERLYHSGLMDEFDVAKKANNLDKLIEIYQQLVTDDYEKARADALLAIKD